MNEPHGRPPLSVQEKVALTIAGFTIFAAALAVAGYFMIHKPRAERRKPVPTVPVVSVQELTLSDYLIVVPAMGTVIPAKEVDLKARVGGPVIWTHPEFIEGGIVKKGQVLVRIDPVDYELALSAKRAVLETAVADLKAEQGKQVVARTEWEILGLGENATDLDRELALRQPQLDQMEANLEAARAEVRQAELELERTVIRAPFNALIRSADVDVGGQAAAQGTLATLVGIDSFYVEALVPLDRIDSIYFPDRPDEPGSIATVNTGSGRVRQARIFKLLGDLEPNGRLAQVLLEVRDPLDLEKPPAERQPMLLGDYVRVDIEGRTLEDVFNIPRVYLKDGQTIYTVDQEDRLRIKRIDIVWQDVASVVAKGLMPGERLVVSELPAAVEGMKVRVQNPESRIQNSEEEQSN